MRQNNRGFLALLVLGGIYLYRNRFRIQQFLERQGIQTPTDREGFADTVRSGVAKIRGRVQGRVDELQDQARKAG